MPRTARLATPAAAGRLDRSRRATRRGARDASILSCGRDISGAAARPVAIACVVLRSRRLETPLGPMLAVANDEGLVLCEFTDRRMLPLQLERVERLFSDSVTPGGHRYIDQAASELTEYFASTRETFTIPLVLTGTSFQTAVWRALLTIPFGATTS